jgi:hypothetical protein
MIPKVRLAQSRKVAKLILKQNLRAFAAWRETIFLMSQHRIYINVIMNESCGSGRT